MRRFLHRILSLFSRSSRTNTSSGNLAKKDEIGAIDKSDHQNNASTDGNDIWCQAFNVTKGTVVASRVAWAGTSDERRRGLLGRASLDRDEGLYIAPTQWIHMFGMRFPIDVAFLASNGRVLYMHHELQPNRLSRPVLRAEGALELAAGTLRDAGVATGDIIEMRSANGMSQ